MLTSLSFKLAFDQLQPSCPDLCSQKARDLYCLPFRCRSPETRGRRRGSRRPTRPRWRRPTPGRQVASTLVLSLFRWSFSKVCRTLTEDGTTNTSLFYTWTFYCLISQAKSDKTMTAMMWRRRRRWRRRRLRNRDQGLSNPYTMFP